MVILSGLFVKRGRIVCGKSGAGVGRRPIQLTRLAGAPHNGDIVCENGGSRVTAFDHRQGQQGRPGHAQLDRLRCAARQLLLDGGAAANWRACRMAASTSRMRRSTATRKAPRATRRRSASSAPSDSRDLSYLELSRLTNRFANVLRALGVGKGERVFVLAGRIPELYVAVLGSFKNGSVVSPLFSAFGPEPIATRIDHRRRARAGHHRSAVPAQDRADPRPAAGAAPRAAGARGRRRTRRSPAR